MYPLLTPNYCVRSDARSPFSSIISLVAWMGSGGGTGIGMPFLKSLSCFGICTTVVVYGTTSNNVKHVNWRRSLPKVNFFKGNREGNFFISNVLPTSGWPERIGGSRIFVLSSHAKVMRYFVPICANIVSMPFRKLAAVRKSEGCNQ